MPRGPIDIPNPESPLLAVPGVVGKAEELAFWEVWRENEPFLHRLCLILMKGDAVEAREMLSGGMMRAYERSGGRIGMIGNPRAWFAQVIRSYTIDHFREIQRSPHFAVDPEFLVLKMDQAPSSHELSPEMDYLNAESYQHLKSAIEDLPDRLRPVMVLRAYQNMPFQEIAQRLRITPENARKRCQEGKLLLEQRLKRPDEANWRSTRRPDGNERRPRSERSAADQAMCPPPMAEKRWTEPIAAIGAEGQTLEWPGAFEERPTRLEQKLESTVRYLERHPGGHKMREDHARLLWATGKWEEAVEEGKQALERHPHNLELRLDLVDWTLALARPGQAEALLEQGLAFTAEEGWVQHLWGFLLHLKGKVAEADQYLEQACASHPGEVRHRALQVALLIQQEEFDQAAGIGRAAFAQGKRDKRLYEWTRIALGRSGQDQELRPWEAKWEPMFPEDTLVRARQIWRAIGEGDPVQEKALRKQIKQFERALPASILPFQLRLWWHVSRGEDHKARKWVRQSLPALHGRGQARVVLDWFSRKMDLGPSSEWPDAEPVPVWVEPLYLFSPYNED